MALRFCDSFDHYVTADVTTKGWVLSGSSPGILAGAGPWGTAALNLPTDGTRYATLTLDSQSTWIVGFDYKYTTAASKWVVEFLDGASQQVWLNQSTEGFLEFRRGASTVIGSRGTTFLRPGIWYYIEVKVVIDGTSGVASVRINGIDELSQTGLNTQGQTSTTANVIRVRGEAVRDNFYVCDGTGSINIDYLGQIKVEALYPTAAGDTTSWTPNTGANYAAVDEVAPDGDTTYVASGTADQVDTYTMGDLATTAGTIKGVQYLLSARKDDAGGRSIAPVARPATTDRVGTTVSLGASYAYVREIAELNPEDSAAWEIADINGMKYGVKLIS